MKNETRIGEFIVAGQPTDDELRALDARGVRLVINVRLPDEQAEPEERLLAPNVAYASVPFTGATLRAEHVQAVRDAAAASEGSILIH